MNTAAGDVFITTGRKERGPRHQPGRLRHHCYLPEARAIPGAHPVALSLPLLPAFALFLHRTPSFLPPGLVFASRSILTRPGICQSFHGMVLKGRAREGSWGPPDFTHPAQAPESVANVGTPLEGSQKKFPIWFKHAAQEAC